ncbi:HEAT repeat domain-containing protein [Paludisphaera sp.]|uniref:HEAT repeat domain-containing protein n=1 Tax=Paludisphaera sp. TaxID=2017432 RepID=UPI00301CE664
MDADPPIDPKDDPRSVDDLFNAALCEPDEDLAWDAVMALHWRGTREILDRATALATSVCPLERRVGAEVLGQLGCPARTFPDEARDILARMLETETNADALKAAIIAMSHQDGTEGRRATLAFREHPDPEVRWAVVQALSTLGEPWAIAGLIELSRDSDPRVRDWSTFGLGAQTDVDTAEVRAALVARLDDEDAPTRGEALDGLARRNDPAVPSILRERLSRADPDQFEVEAAGELGDPEFLPLLLALRSAGWPGPSWALDGAIAACAPAPMDTPPARPRP